LRQFADVEANLKRAEELLDKAFAMGCEMVILPEFFTSAVAFHPDMLNAALPFDGPAREDHPFRGPAGRLLDPQAALAHQVGVAAGITNVPMPKGQAPTIELPGTQHFGVRPQNFHCGQCRVLRPDPIGR
jgi:hypothetical protein